MRRPNTRLQCEDCGEYEYKGEGVTITVEEGPDGLWRCDHCMEEYEARGPLLAELDRLKREAQEVEP